MPTPLLNALLAQSGTLLTGLLGLGLGGYVLVRWGRRRELAEFAWFGIIFLVWGLRSLQAGLGELPLPGSGPLRVQGWVGTWSAVLFGLFALRLSRSEAPDWRPPRQLGTWLLGHGLLVSTLVALVPTAWITGWQMAWAHAVGAAIVLWGQWRLLHLALSQRRVELWVPAALAPLYLLLALLAWWLDAAGQGLSDHLARQFGSAPLFLSAGWLLAHRYWQAVQTRQRLADSLQDEVQRQRAQIEQQYEQHYEQQRQAEQTQARAEERARLMRDLHDGLGLHLVSALRQTTRGSGPLPREALAATLQDALDELRIAIDSLGDSAHDPLTLLGTLRFRLAPRFAAAGLSLGWEVTGDFDAAGDEATLPAEAALHLLRLVQEVLGNALKHSGASQVTLRLGWGCGTGLPPAVGGTPQPAQGTLSVSVSDNGCGFDPAQVREGRGLVHLRQRCQALGAHSTLHSAPGAGTTWHLWLPWPAAQALPGQAPGAAPSPGDPTTAPGSAWPSSGRSKHTT